MRDEDGAHVVAEPFVEHADEEPSPRFGVDGAFGDPVALLESRVVVALDDGDELDEPGAEVVSEVAVDVGRMVLVRRVHRAQDVEFHVVLGEQLEAPQHPFRRGVSPFVDPIAVVELGGPVDADADQEPMLGEQLAPGIVQKRAVGLDGVLDPLARPAVTLGQLERPAEELQPHERGLAALPRDRDLGGRGVGLEELAHVGLEQLIGHSKAIAGIERLLGQEEAVLAIEIANRSGRLGQDVEFPWSGRWPRLGHRDGRGHGTSPCRECHRHVAHVATLTGHAMTRSWSRTGREDLT